MMLYFIPATLFLTFLALGGVHSYHTIALFVLLLGYWLIEYGCQVRYGMKRIFQTKLEYPVIALLIYGGGILLYRHFFPQEQTQFNPFYQLWKQVGISADPGEVSGGGHLWSGMIALLQIAIFLIWFKWILIFKKAVFKLKLPLLLIYITPVILYLLNISPGVIWGSERSDVPGCFVNLNHLASFISIPLPVIIYYLFLRRRHLPWDQGLFRLTLLLIPVGIMVQLNGRMALISTACVVVIYLLINWRSINPLFSLILSTMVIGGASFIMITKKIIAGSDFSTFFQVKNLLEEDHHWELISRSVTLFQEHWLTGVGAGQFPVSYSMINPRDLMFVHHLHNEYFQFIIEFGVVGILCMVWFFYVVIRMAIYGLKTLQGEYRGLFKAVLFSLILFHIQIFTGYQLHILTFILLYGLLLGMLYILIYHYHRFYNTNDERRNL